LRKVSGYGIHAAAIFARVADKVLLAGFAAGVLIIPKARVMDTLVRASLGLCTARASLRIFAQSANLLGSFASARNTSWDRVPLFSVLIA
jgi:hypothetical protein